MEQPLAQDLIAGRFAIEREVGRGAAGVVYRAYDHVSQSHVALKVIGVLGVDSTERARIVREGQILSELAHPHIVRMVAFGTVEGKCTTSDGYPIEEGATFIAMEWLSGEDLSTRRKREPLSLRQSIEIGKQIAFALAAAHDCGVVHRDIKPSNIVLVRPQSEMDREAPPVSGFSSDPRRNGAEGAAAKSSDTLIAKLVDFGVAAQNDVRLTLTGAIIGTPAYMAPEQARGDIRADVRSDIYSLGATLFELISGRPPHVGPTSIATLARLVTAPAPRLSEVLANVPPELDELIDRMLQSDPAQRPSSAREVALKLEAISAGDKLPEQAKLLEVPADLPVLASTRLVTTLVALGVGTGDVRLAAIGKLQQFGADALPLGSDAIVAHLGVRRAEGDEAVRAIEAAKELSKQHHARVGIATGKMRVDKMRLASEAVDRAAALAREAGDLGVLADATTVQLARRRFAFDVRADGSAVVGQVLAAKREATTVARFYGREQEYIVMLSAYKRCIDERTPVLLTLSGPPGIGKTRLLREWVMQVGSISSAPHIAQVRCESYRKGHALGIVTDALRALLGLPKGASLEQATAALRAHKLFHEGAGLLAKLLSDQPFVEGLEQSGTRDALYLSMTELVLDVAAEKPCALLLEDVQWADSESIAWIEHLLGRATQRPLFVLMNMRPSFWRDQPQRFKSRDHVRIELRPMGRRSIREIARSLIGTDVSDKLLDQIAQQAAGSPLFAEELARVIAQGNEVTSAPTIEAAIQVSLDALDDGTREAVVRMSVLGQSVWVEAGRAVGVADPEAALRKLVAAQLMVENPSSRFADTREYVYKHALVREVAYASLSDDLRKALHTSAANWFADVGEDSATIAQHFDLGGEFEQAADYWEAAAKHALATNSLQDAVRMSDRALTFANDKPTAFARAMLLNQAYSRLDPRSSERGEAIRAMADNVFDEVSDILTLGAQARYDDARGATRGIEERLCRVRERAYQLDLADEEVRCSATLAHRYAFSGQLDLARGEANHLLDLSERKQIVWAAVDAWQALAIVHQTRGELGEALSARRNAVRAARVAGLQEREAMLSMNVGFALTTLGARKEALDEIEAGMSKAKAIGSAGAVRHGQMVLLCWTATFGPEARLDAVLEEPRASADEAAGGMWVVRDRTTLGVLFYRGCELLRGDSAALPRARLLLKLAVESYRLTENRDVLPVALGFWAEAERRFGNAEGAVELAREAAALVDLGEPSLLNEAPIFLALHDALVDVGDLRGARNAMERAMKPLLRRLSSLKGTPYARPFLLELSHNVALLSTAEAYGLAPPEIEEILLASQAALGR